MRKENRPGFAPPAEYPLAEIHAVKETIMTRKQRHLREERMLLPPSPPPRNPFATTAKMRRGVAIHEKSRGAKRRELHMTLARVMRGDFSAFEHASRAISALYGGVKRDKI
jgi:hypothetical protein